MFTQVIETTRFEYQEEIITVELIKWDLGYQVVASNAYDNKWYTTLKTMQKFYKTEGHARNAFNRVNGSELRIVK